MKATNFLAAMGLLWVALGGPSLAAGADNEFAPDYWKKRAADRKAREIALVNAIHEKIVAINKESNETEMKLYTNTIPAHAPTEMYTWLPQGSVSFVMVPIPGGEFLMGSPETEPSRQKDEGPQHKVKLSPFWMEQCEVTWDEYKPFMINVDEEKLKDATYKSEVADAVSKPSKPYLEMSFGMGEQGYPAVAMTQHAANKYCEWLSAKTGHFHRLPTEAEWEYACRAGTTTAYSFGNEPAKLSDYAWHGDSDIHKYQRVRRKKPNPWGLYDMHGNVAEWCLDQYDPNFYMQGKDKVSENPWNVVTKRFPHVIRGGAWDSFDGALALDRSLSEPAQLRSAARLSSRSEWNTDSMLPQTAWYLDQARIVGFRIVRPLRIPSAEEMYRYWNTEVEAGQYRGM